MPKAQSIADLREKVEAALRRLAEVEAQKNALADAVKDGEPAAMASCVNLTNEADDLRSQIEAADRTLQAPASRRVGKGRS